MRSFTLGAVLLAAVLLSQAQGSFWPYIYTPVEKDLEDEICKTLGDIPLPFASDNFCNGTGNSRKEGALQQRCSIAFKKSNCESKVELNEKWDAYVT